MKMSGVLSPQKTFSNEYETLIEVPAGESHSPATRLDQQGLYE